MRAFEENFARQFFSAALTNKASQAAFLPIISIQQTSSWVSALFKKMAFLVLKQQPTVWTDSNKQSNSKQKLNKSV